MSAKLNLRGIGVPKVMIFKPFQGNTMLKPASQFITFNLELRGKTALQSGIP